MVNGLIYKVERIAMGVPMATAKEQIKQVIEAQPEDASYEELVRELVFGRMVDRGLEDSRKGRMISDEEMGRRIQLWRK